MPPFVAPALVLVFVGLVLAAALKDAFSFTIPNWISLALVAATMGAPLWAVEQDAGLPRETPGDRQAVKEMPCGYRYDQGMQPVPHSATIDTPGYGISDDVVTEDTTHLHGYAVALEKILAALGIGLGVVDERDLV